MKKGYPIRDPDELKKSLLDLPPILRHKEVLAALFKSTQAVLQYRTFQDAARSIFNVCKDLVAAAAGYVAILSDDGTENILVFLDSGGMECSVDPSLPMPIRGLRGEAYARGKVVYENNFNRSDWTKFLPPGHSVLDNVLFAPLIIEGKTLGLLGLANKRGGFNDHDAEIAAAFGNHAAIALLNSRMIESLEASQEHFRCLVDAANDAIITTNHEGRIISWNQSAEKMFGLSPQEALGQSLTIIMPVRYQEAHSSGMARIVSSGESRLAGKTMTLVAKRSNGMEFPIELSLARWTTSRGTFFTGIVRDISLRQEAEHNLKEAEERFRLIVETSNDLMALVDVQGNLRWNNPVFQTVTGYTPQNVGDVFDKIHPADRQRMQNVWRSIKETGPPVDKVKYRFLNQHGEYRYLESTIHWILLSRESLLFITSQDVTELVNLRRKVTIRRGLTGIIGQSPQMLDLIESIRDLSVSEVPVLIQGESGTGKELVASAIHQEGPRADKTFLPVNCAAIPDTLLESELFGHVKGSFTGAFRDKKGRFELADGGTIFLDEVGDLSPTMQVKLLRILQKGTFERVGDEKTMQVNVRVISATHKDLKKAMATGQFREDLYYRLSVVPLTIPPLRERYGDIPLLINHILEEESLRAERRADPSRSALRIQVSPQALSLLIAYQWPGNIRELQNVLRFALIKCKGDTIKPEHLPPVLSQKMAETANTASPLTAKNKIDSNDISIALEKANGHKGKAAKMLGISRATFYRILSRIPSKV